jgi:glycosyltransferase involved in cell wall biosynthesis
MLTKQPVNDEIHEVSLDKQTQRLVSPIKISDQVWPDGTIPLVSIACVTYNHKGYIRQCLEGFLSQVTTFPVEILVHDDASYDGTSGIIREYASNFPTIVKPIFQKENQYSRGVRPLRDIIFPLTKGKYTALCEGDDYWTDPNKLSKQVDALEEDTSAALCLHNSIIQFETGESAPKVAIKRVKKVLDLYDFIDLDYFHESGGLTSRGHTSSLVFRTQLASTFPPWFKKAASGDLYLQMFLASNGVGLFIDEVMSVYRVNSGGITRSSPAHQGHTLAKNRIEMLSYVNEYFDKQFDRLIKKQMAAFHKKEFVSYINEKRVIQAVPHAFNAMRLLDSTSRVDLVRSAYWSFVRRVKSSAMYYFCKRNLRKLRRRGKLSFNPANFIRSQKDESMGAYTSVPNGSITLYGTCYGLLTQRYLDERFQPSTATFDFILACQDKVTGLFHGPEILPESASSLGHNKEHLLYHLTCTTLPVLQQWTISPKHPVYAAHKFTKTKFLNKWLDERDLTDAWLEGNNLLFIGQLLVYLRDFEKHPEAAKALQIWFEWLDRRIDPKTGLWGTDGFCSNYHGMYGGYHQLLVYYHENRPIHYKEALVDTVLSLQHHDGGFSQNPGGGACEDVDAVDILVNMYKQIDYKRPEIRQALKRNLDLILSIQNKDGGFPYNKTAPSQSHMNIPATRAGQGESTMFATWFRIHTIALIAEVLPEVRLANKFNFDFSKYLSMGWHPRNK